MSKIKTVYVTQYDYFWSFTAAEWLAFVKEVIQTDFHGGDGYMLPSHKELKHRPRTIAAESDNNSYYSRRNDVHLAHPLDWGLEEFQCELEYLTEEGVR